MINQKKVATNSSKPKVRPGFTLNFETHTMIKSLINKILGV